MSASAQTAETSFLEGLRSRYEQEGFDFTIGPDRRDLPDFLGSCTPDAVARKSGRNVAITVKRAPTSATPLSLQGIRRLFEGHPDWQFNVAVIGADPLDAVTIPAGHPAVIRTRLDEVRLLSAEGHRAAAFVMAWALLEAAFHTTTGETTSKPRRARGVLQMLAMNGYIEPALERRMRPLVELRDRIVHGDVTIEPTPEDIELVLTAILETLAEFRSVD